MTYTYPSKVAIAFWINLIFAAMYTITLVIYTLIGRLPAYAPWIPIAAEHYYRYQALWTIAWGLATWIMMAGICHLLAIAGTRAARRLPVRGCIGGWRSCASW